MSALSVQVPFPVFQDRDGQPLENGYVWTGEPKLNPQTNPVVAYFDAALTIPAAQPLRTLNGYISRAGTPAQIYVDGVNFSILVQDSKGSMVYNFPDGSGISPDACGVTYNPPFTDSVAYPVCEKLAQTISVMDFGAVGDGIANDTVAIQAAVAACPAGGATLYFPPGTYVVTAPITFSGKSNLNLFGYGATIQCGATRIQSYFNVTGTSTVRLFGFSFNAKLSDMPLYTPADYDARFNVGIYADTNTTDIVVRDCRFYNLYTEGIFARNVNTLDVQDCVFESPVQAQDQQLQHIWFLTSANLRVVNNKFLNAANTNPAYLPCGVFASGVTNSAFVDRNFFNYCGRNNQGSHKLGVIDFYFDCVNVIVTNNIAKNVMSQFMRLSACDGAVVENNYVEINQFAEFDGNTFTVEGGAIFSPFRNTRNNNIKILNNTFYDPFGRAAVTLTIGCYDWGAWSQNILIQGNIFTDSRTAVLLGGAYYSVNIVDNMMYSNSGAPRGGIRVESSTLTTNYGTEANSYFSGLLIAGNTMRINVPGGIQINIPTLTTAYVGATTIKNNTIEALTQTAIVAIAYNINASVKSFANLSVEGNNIYRMSQAFQINNGGNVAVKDNFTVSTVAFATESGNNAYDAYDNKMQSGGVSTGIATLVAGVATVSNVDCRTNDNVILSVYRNGGTVGVPFTSSVSNGSFAIQSTSGADTSQIAWKIIH